MKRTGKYIMLCLLVVITALVSSALTLHLTRMPASKVETAAVLGKMNEIGSLLEAYFIDEYDPETVENAAADGAAAAMIAATGDRWSYYIPAESMDDYQESFYNEYVGIGIIIRTTDRGMEILSVTPGGSAEAAGLQAGDLVTHVEGQDTTELGLQATKELVRGEPGTMVKVAVLRDGTPLELEITRQQIVSPVAEGKLLENGIGWLKIHNFDHHCAEQTLSVLDELLQQGAKALLFDLRFNGGGMKDEMVEILDVLLPEGELFRSKDYAGKELVDYSDAACVELPMAVLINEDSYSAAEFFAAALQEYEAAVIVGTQTVGKGNYQYTIPLRDGSAVALSSGKYFTPKGKSLTDVGVTPDLPVDLSDEDYADLYYGNLSAEEDEQFQKAVSELLTKIS